MYPGPHARTAPDKPAVVMAGSGRTVTYAELDERSTRLGRWWHAAGLRSGDGVAMLLPSRPEVLEIYWAAIRSGLYVTAINYNLSAEEAAYIVTDSAAKSLIVDPALGELATEVGRRCGDVGLRLSLGASAENFGDYEAALAGSDPTHLEHEPRGADMLYSSGTTGRPKGVKLPLPGTLVAEDPGTVAGLAAALWAFGPETVYLSPAPMYHAAPLPVLRRGPGARRHGGDDGALRRGAGPGRDRGPTALPTASGCRRCSCACSSWSRTYAPATTSPACATRSMPPRRAPVEVKAAMLDWWGPLLHEYYASTENSGLTAIGPQDWIAHPGSVGRPALGIVHICDDDGRELSSGAPGNVYFEREFVPFTYHNDPDKTAASRHPEHQTWTTTGDVGFLDSEGFLYLTDRKAYMIISGGVNIYPQEIEDALALHPAIDDVAVLGIPDEEMGERVKAFVQAAPAATPGPALEHELIAFLRERIAGFKIPRVWEFRDQLPRAPTGKLAKHLLKESGA